MINLHIVGSIHIIYIILFVIFLIYNLFEYLETDYKINKMNLDILFSVQRLQKKAIRLNNFLAYHTAKMLELELKKNI